MRNNSKMQSIFALVLIFSMALSLTACSASAPNAAPTYGAKLDGNLLDSNSESYTQIVENPFVSTGETNTSYFSIDANTASYPNLRSMIRKLTRTLNVNGSRAVVIIQLPELVLVGLLGDYTWRREGKRTVDFFLRSGYTGIRVRWDDL